MFVKIILEDIRIGYNYPSHRILLNYHTKKSNAYPSVSGNGRFLCGFHPPPTVWIHMYSDLHIHICYKNVFIMAKIHFKTIKQTNVGICHVMI